MKINEKNKIYAEKLSELMLSNSTLRVVAMIDTDGIDDESSRDIEEIEEVMGCDADAKTKCKMISNILNAKPYYFKEQEPCEYVEGD